MDTTRQSIQDTLGELKERVQESADWRHQVGRRPLTSIWVAVACGLVLARILAQLRRLVGHLGLGSRSW
jgi:hypothetical protein